MTPSPESPRPYVIVATTMSLDGRVTVGPDRLLLDPIASEAWQAMHPPGSASAFATRTALIERTHHPTAVLEGSGSFVTADVTARHPFGPPDGPPDDFLPPEIAERAAHRRWFVVVDGRGRVDWTMPGEGDTDLLVLVCRSTPPGYLAELRRKRICHLVAGHERVDLSLALRRLRHRLGVGWVVAEGGGGLTAALLAQSLVDEVHVVVLPVLVGGATTPSIVDGGMPLPVPTRLTLSSSRAEPDGVLSLRYAVDRKVAD